MIKLKETTMRKTWVVCLLAMVCCALWGSAFPCIKVGYRLFQIDSADTATQILFAGCRFTIAGIMVILFGSILQGRFLKAGKGDLPRIGKICLLQTVVQYFFFYVGLAHTTGVKGSIVEASNVFLAILVSSLIFHQEKLDHLYELKEHMMKRVAEIDGVVINSQPGRESAPQIVSVSFEGVRSEVLLHALEDRGIYVSSGSACSSNHPGVSGTLKGIGVKQELLDSTLRFSFGMFNKKEEIDYAIEVLKELLPVLRRYRRG